MVPHTILAPQILYIYKYIYIYIYIIVVFARTSITISENVVGFYFLKIVRAILGLH